jgi:hypothetical protein
MRTVCPVRRSSVLCLDCIDEQELSFLLTAACRCQAPAAIGPQPGKMREDQPFRLQLYRPLRNGIASVFGEKPPDLPKTRSGRIHPANRWLAVRFRTSMPGGGQFLKATVRQRYSLVLWHQEFTFRTRFGKSLAIRNPSVIVSPWYLANPRWRCRGNRRTNSRWEH